MANVKISQLPVLSVPVTGSELVPVVQGAVTYQATVSQLAAGIASTNVKAFGAVGDGVTDDTVAIQAAVDSLTSGGSVFFPKGVYLISSVVTTSYNAIILEGESRDACEIKQTTMASGILNVTGIFSGVRGLSFRYQGTPTADAVAVRVAGSHMTISDILIHNCHTGVSWIAGTVAGKITDFDILNYVSSGIMMDGVSDVFVSNFIINAGSPTNGMLGGIRLLNKTEAIVVTDGDILLGAYPITMAASVYDRGTRPAYNRFTNVYFDSAVNGALITQCVETDFVGCWFSNGRSGSGNPGAYLLECESIRFTNTTFFNNGSHGVKVGATAVDTVFIGCNADSNSITSGAGVSNGYQFDAGVGSFKMVGCTASNGLFPGTQGYGVSIGVGCDNFIISNCDLTGNLTAGLLDSSSATATKFITSNIGVTVSQFAGSSALGTAEATDTHNIKGVTTISADSVSSAMTVTQTGAGTGFTVVGGSLDISASTSGQIVFPAVQNPSSNVNTLDDYEEGTWIPVLTFATIGNLSVSYAAQSAGYTKIGRMVMVKFFIQTSAFTHTTASGNLIITGLPFISENTIESYGALSFSGITKATYTDFVAAVLSNTQSIVVRANGSGVGSAAVTAADMPTGGTVILRGTIVYNV